MQDAYLAAAIITAGGIGRRMGSSTPKQYITLHDRPIIIHTLTTFQATGFFKQIILVVPADQLEPTKRLLQEYQADANCEVISGGASRQDSVRNGINALRPEITHVSVHDGVRPLTSPELIKNCLEAAYAFGAAISAIPVKDTLKKSSDKRQIEQTVERSHLWRAQTPQSAKVSLLQAAYQKAEALNFTGTDESSLLELINCPVTLVEGSESNIKITVPEDIPMAEAILNAQQPYAIQEIRTGHGYDAHRLTSGRALVLGGVTIDHPTGLLGHSDADVLTHALCDAILGASGAGDLGQHFPDTDRQYKDANSLMLLKTVMDLCHSAGFQLGNADITVIAQKPKLAPYIEAMKENLAEVCGVPVTSINIKATTTEKMGFTGREEGMSCHAVVLIRR